MNNLRLSYALLSAARPALFAWLRQTSTILGLAGVAGIVVGAVMGELQWNLAIPALASSLVAIVMPGHPEAAEAVRAAAADAVALSDAATRAAALRTMPADLVVMAEQLGLDPATVALGRVALGLVPPRPNAG